MKMMQTAPAAVDPVGSEKKAGFDFYNGFLTVVYGLLITNGLGFVVPFTSDPARHWESTDAFLFLGTFLASLHFWFVCATVDDLSTDFYQTFVGGWSSFFGLFVLIDVLVATALAGSLLGMFDSAPKAPASRFYLWFLITAVLSVAYDLYSRLLIVAARVILKRDPLKTDDYRKRINGWIQKDSIFLAVAALMYFGIAKNVVSNSMGFSSVFMAFTIGLLLMDVCSFQRNGRSVLAPVNTRAKPGSN